MERNGKLKESKMKGALGDARNIFSSRRDIVGLLGWPPKISHIVLSYFGTFDKGDAWESLPDAAVPDFQTRRLGGG